MCFVMYAVEGKNKLSHSDFLFLESGRSDSFYSIIIDITINIIIIVIKVLVVDAVGVIPIIINMW